MFIRMNQTIARPDGPRMAGRVYVEPDDVAAELIRSGHAVISAEPPEYVAHLLARLDDGAGKPCVFLPFVGEFGHLVMSHARLVHFHRASVKVVCCRPGERVLFPSAQYFVMDWADPIADRYRIATMRDRFFEWPAIRAEFPGHHFPAVGRLAPKQEIYPIRPEERIPFEPIRRGHRADVVFGVRRRDFCPERNWRFWPRLAEYCRVRRFTYAVVGAADTSFDLDGQVMRTNGDTDAAVELLQTCKLYVGTDSGNSHLAAAVGAPMLIFRETAAGSRDLTPHMRAINPGRVDVVADGWNDPDRVAVAMLNRLVPP